MFDSRYIHDKQIRAFKVLCTDCTDRTFYGVIYMYFCHCFLLKVVISEYELLTKREVKMVGYWRNKNKAKI